MNNKKRRIILLIVVLVIGLIFLGIYNAFEEVHYKDAYFSYIERGFKDTNAPNLVAAIYLNYRVFDTMFEALLLAISVTAIVYFAIPWKKKEDKDEK